MPCGSYLSQCPHLGKRLARAQQGGKHFKHRILPGSGWKHTHTLASRAEFSNGGIYRDGSGAAFREMRVAAGRGPGTPLPRRGKGSNGQGGLAELEPVSGNRQKLLEETRPLSSPWWGGARGRTLPPCSALPSMGSCHQEPSPPAGAKDPSVSSVAS